jgi:hypothetical protein
MTETRRRYGRPRPPQVVTRDAEALSVLRDAGTAGLSRNEVAGRLGVAPRLASYALHRLRRLGIVRHVPRGNEGHGYWAVSGTKSETHSGTGTPTGTKSETPTETQEAGSGT